MLTWSLPRDLKGLQLKMYVLEVLRNGAKPVQGLLVIGAFCSLLRAIKTVPDELWPFAAVVIVKMRISYHDNLL